VALAGIHVNISINVFPVTVDDVFAVELVVVPWRVIGPKSIRIDGQRLLLVVGEQESNGRFLGGFRWQHVAVVCSPINQNEHRRLVLGIFSPSACR
jgi:hypothetical protein